MISVEIFLVYCRRLSSPTRRLKPLPSPCSSPSQPSTICCSSPSFPCCLHSSLSFQDTAGLIRRPSPSCLQLLLPRSNPSLAIFLPPLQSKLPITATYCPLIMPIELPSSPSPPSIPPTSLPSTSHSFHCTATVTIRQLHRYLHSPDPVAKEVPICRSR